MFSTPETSVHVQDKNREISPLEREEGYGGKDLEKRWVLRREWKTLWDTPTTDLGAESEPGNGGEYSEVADWQGTGRDGGTGIVIQAQKLLGTALKDNLVPFRIRNDAQAEFYTITDVQPVKDVAPHVRETTVKFPSVGDESSISIHYPLQFLCCGLRRASQQALGIVDNNKSVH